jgi:hydrogenase maturation protease
MCSSCLRVNKQYIRTILFAIGNNARQDDGLGWAFGEALEKNDWFDGEVHFRYQLEVEDSELVSHAKQAIFVDAFKGELPNGFQWKTVEPTSDFEFTTHALSPQAVLFFCEQLYGKKPAAHCLLIGGDAWELGEGLTEESHKNLQSALNFLENTFGGLS